jgi:hypothetical protein
MANPNLELLTDAAKLLEPLLGELVFVGGCATALLITDKAAADVRPTLDVDAIAEITSYAGYNTFSGRLKKLGFQEDTREDAPRCRWRQETTTLDVMPLDPKVLGFSNSWYRPAMEHSEERELENGLKIRLVAPVYFCASSSRLLSGAEMMILPGAGIWKTLLLLSTVVPNCSVKFELRRAMRAVTWRRKSRG